MTRHLPPLWRVRLDRHSVPPRYLVPARSATVPPADEDHAREIVMRVAHRDAGVAPWRPCIARSLTFTSAKRTDAVPSVAVVPAHAQLALRDAA